MPETILREQTIAGSDNVTIHVALGRQELAIRYQPPPTTSSLSIFLALGTHREIGSAILPFAQHSEGSTLFLPFKADLLLSCTVRPEPIQCWSRRWKHWRWTDREQTQAFQINVQAGAFQVRIPRKLLGDARMLDLIIYAKDPVANHGWGWLWGCSDASVIAGPGDKYIPHYHELHLPATQAAATKSGSAQEQSRSKSRSSGSVRTVPLLLKRERLPPLGSRIRIYQLFVRLFGNTNETRKQNGTLTENGVGRFADINDAAISSLKKIGFTHIWLTGVLRQASGTDYSEIGQQADDPDLLKGLAGSPYAIKDYFDVCPDYALQPANRLKEFEELLQRLHTHGVKAIIDLVANHVARNCDSSIRPEHNFGSRGQYGLGDDKTKFFDPKNNFFYLRPDGNGPPLRLPTWKNGTPISPTCQLPGMQCDGLFEGETNFGRVTGNNVVSWTPALCDWYETVKLNYGFDFTDPSKSVREYPNARSPLKPVPDTWKKIDRIIAHWQSLGVDGFRCDMAHLVPPEFWSWVIAQARQREPDTLFIGEAYDDDPSKVPGSDPVAAQLYWGNGNVLVDLLNAGFDAVYDAPAYRALKRIYDGSGWANDIDREISEPFICNNSVRYAENHDEVRLAAPSHWGGLGMEVGRPVSAVLYGLSRGAILLYGGQEVGEPALGSEGFGSEDARTSIFDYWSMPELVKWVNEHRYDGGRLSPQQTALRDFYGRLIQLIDRPAFRDGEFFPLNPANRENPEFGRLPGEPASGHWLYAYLRYDRSSRERFLVLANLHPTISLTNVRVKMPMEAIQFLDLKENAPETPLELIDRLRINSATGTATTLAEASAAGIHLLTIPPLTPLYLEFRF